MAAILSSIYFADHQMKVIKLALICASAGLALNGCSSSNRPASTNTSVQQTSTQAGQMDANNGLPQPQDATGYVALGNELYKRDEDERAVEAYQQALKLEPDN